VRGLDPRIHGGDSFLDARVSAFGQPGLDAAREGAGPMDADAARLGARVAKRHWRRRVVGLALPMVVSNATVPLLGIVDTAVVGHLASPAHLGGVAVGSLLFGYVYWSFGFLRQATGGLAAQSFGAGDGDELRAGLARAGLVALGAGAVLIVLLAPFLHPLLGLVGASPEVEGHALSYARVRLASAPATLANYALLGALIGLQRPRSALVLMLVTNGVNIVLALAFVMGFGWGVPGVAAATVISEYIGAVTGAGLLARALRPHPGRLEWLRVWDARAALRLARLNRDIFVRNLALTSAFSLFTVIGARLGDATLAANAVLMNFHTLAGYVLDGFADAAEALVGQAVGRRDPGAVRAAIRAAAEWITILALLGVALFWACGELLIDVMTGLPEVRAEARVYLVYLVLAPVLGCWAFLLDGVFVGATRGAEMRNAMLGAFATFTVLAVALTPAIGNHGLWAAYVVFMLARAGLLGLYVPRLVRSVG
jgi:MATE family multidrug resistance protein